jgi:hypothetical protein
VSFHSSLAAVVIASAALLHAGGLQAQDVRYDYDRSADFTKYKSYKWVQIEGATYPDQLEDRNIRTAIDAELSKKGLVLKQADPVDVFVAYQVAVEQDKEINTYGGGVGWRRGMGTATVSNVNVGTLVVDFYDPATKTMVWQGSGTKSVSTDEDPDKRQEKLEKGVEKLLKNYPPAPKR